MEDMMEDIRKDIEAEACRDASGETVAGTSGESGKNTSGETGSDSVQNIDSIKKMLEESNTKRDEYFTMLQRAAAEFDNYKKRTLREKEGLYSEAVKDVVSAFIPVVDNLERAMQNQHGIESTHCFVEGIEMVVRQFRDVLGSLGVQEIKAIGEKFDPQLHHAVMHVDDESLGENVILEEFQKGYIIGDKIIRHSLVKVAN